MAAGVVGPEPANPRRNREAVASSEKQQGIPQKMNWGDNFEKEPLIP